MIKAAFFAGLLCAALPAYAQIPAADPAALALARGIVGKIAPDGSYRQIMKGTMDQILNSMTGQMMSVPIKQFLAGTGVSADQVAKLNNVTARDIMAIMDPAFDQRMRITMTTMTGSMGDVLSTFEPRIREGMAEAYVHNFTLTQLAEIDHFFATPTGAAYAGRMMLLMNDPSIQASMKELMPAIVQAMPAAAQKVEAATASLPKPKTFADLSAADRARMAKLLGVDPAELKKAKSQ